MATLAVIAVIELKSQMDRAERMHNLDASLSTSSNFMAQRIPDARKNT
jgi:hypothetical protein